MIEIFFSYAHADETLMDEVRRQLIVHERNGRIVKWYDRQIPAGDEWRHRIDGRLNAAQVILLFVSPHFIESKYCYEVEGKRALARHHDGTAIVIPVILRPCSWHDAPFGKLQALPRDGKPISQWDDVDVASLDVASGVMKAVDGLMSGSRARNMTRTRRVSTQNKKVKRVVAKKPAGKRPSKKARGATRVTRKARKSKRRTGD